MACGHGVSEVTDSGIERVLQQLREFNAARNWEQFHDPKNLAMLVASEAGELMAKLRWVPNSDADDFVNDEQHRPQIVEEVADIGIALLLLCDRAAIDLVAAMEKKIEVNAGRYPLSSSKGVANRVSSSRGATEK